MRSGLLCPQGLLLLGWGCRTLGIHRRRRGRGADRRPPGAVACAPVVDNSSRGPQGSVLGPRWGRGRRPRGETSLGPGPDSGSHSHAPLEAALLAPGTPGLGLAAMGAQGVTSRWALSLSASQKPKPTGGPGAWWPEGRKGGRPGSPGGCEAGEGPLPEAPHLALHPVQGRERTRFRTSGAELPASGRCGRWPGAVTGRTRSVPPLTATQAAERRASVLPTQGSLLPSHASGPTPSVPASVGTLAWGTLRAGRGWEPGSQRSWGWVEGEAGRQGGREAQEVGAGQARPEHCPPGHLHPLCTPGQRAGSRVHLVSQPGAATGAAPSCLCVCVTAEWAVVGAPSFSCNGAPGGQREPKAADLTRRQRCRGPEPPPQETPRSPQHPGLSPLSGHSGLGPRRRGPHPQEAAGAVCLG